jgi:hypothetical protein
MSVDMFPDAAIRHLLERSPDWSILSEPLVDETIQAAAAKVVRQYPTEEAEDLAQEGRIIAATKTGEARRTLAQGVGAFHQMIWRDLTDLVKNRAPKQERQCSYEVLVDRALGEESLVSA